VPKLKAINSRELASLCQDQLLAPPQTGPRLSAVDFILQPRDRRPAIESVRYFYERMN